MNEPYKVELVKEHSDKGEHITFYKQGEFIDLCAGPHLMSVAPIKAIELTACTGAYWRGDANNAQLCRVYGVAFPKASMLEEHLKKLEEAKLRDHNKLGRELEYFTTVDYVGQGLPILLPKGARVVQLLQRWVEDVEQSKGCLLKKLLFLQREIFIRFQVTGIIILTVCLYSAIRMMKKRNASHSSYDLPIPVSGLS